MSRPPCPVPTCDRPSAGGLMCGACQAELSRALDAVPEVVRELNTTLSRQTSRSGAGGRPSETPLPYDARASEAMWVLRNALVGWVRTLEVEPLEGPVCPTCAHPSCRMVLFSRGAVDTCQSMAAWLSAGLSRLVRHPAAEEAHGEIVSAVRAAERVVDRPAGYVYAGPCGECGYALYAKPGATTVPCRQPDCPAKPVNVTERRDWMRAQCEDLLGTPSEVSMICAGLGVTVSPSTIRVWVSRKKIFPRRFVRPLKEDGKPRALYRVGDVIKRASGIEDDEAYTVEGESYVVG